MKLRIWISEDFDNIGGACCKFVIRRPSSKIWRLTEEQQ
jgi:hypothetical protein